MHKIKISDVTLRESETNFSFKEKIEIVKGLDKLNVNIIETPLINNTKSDILFLHTIAPLLNNSKISCTVQLDEESIEQTANALKDAAGKRLHLMIPTSSVQMEYICHKKPNAVLELTERLVKKCVSLCDDVEFSAIDATRSEKDFLYSVITVAIKSGAKNITVCDNAGEMMPDEFKYFIKDLYDNIPELKNVNLGIECSDQLHMAAACMISSVDAGVTTLKTTINGEVLPALDAFSKILRARGDSIGIYSDINYNDLETTTEKLLFSTNSAAKGSSLFKNRIFTDEAADITLNKDDDIKTVAAVVKKLGYDLSDEDISNVYEAFSKVAVKKNINARELDTIIASSALQVAPTYKIKSFLINSGNIITASAHIVLEKNGEEKQAVCIGDGPIDAAFITIEKIVDRHFELDDFQIQSVTEGREAVGSALVKLRAHGKLYSGKGISTDIIGASINAYINAINKIFFEEM